MATSGLAPQPPPPIQTNTAGTTASTISPISPSEGSSTITPGVLSASSKTCATPFTPFPPTPDYDDVESPSLTLGNALARFEFERLDSRDARDVGTKVLMVEWEEDASTAPMAGEWTVGWEGKSVAAIVPTEAQAQTETETETSVSSVTEGGVKKFPSQQRGQLHRLYFLLPQWARVPGTVILTLTGARQTGEEQVRPDAKPVQHAEKIVWRTHPLPAIYPAALGNSARASGKRGVLHTIWAKKRLQSLASEIEVEQLQNPEGVSLDLAIQERDWIERNFGVKTRKTKDSTVTATEDRSPVSNAGQGGLNSPSSPKSPGRGPFLEKLKGLKLATETQDLQPPPSLSTDSTEEVKEHNPLSPETADVAVSWPAFATLSGFDQSQARDSLAAKAPQRTTQFQPSQQPQVVQPQQMRPIAPPESVLEQQRQLSGMGSLNAFTAPATSSSEVQFRRSSVAVGSDQQSQSHLSAERPGVAHSNTDEDDLFALPMSPRPETNAGIKKFTFGEADTARYVPGERMAGSS